VQLKWIEQFGQRQFGLVTRDQVLAEHSSDDLKYLLRHDYLVRVRQNVYRPAGTPVVWEQDLMALTLSNSRYVASHRAAARLWSLGNIWTKDILEVSTTSAARHRLRDVVIHKSILPAHHMTEHRGIRVTTLERTLVDLAATSHQKSIDFAIDQALSSRRTTIESLEDTLIDARRPGRPNILRVAELIEKRCEHLSQSALQRKTAKWITSAGLPMPHHEFRVQTRWSPYDLDLAYPEHRIGIECNGFVAHGYRTQFDRDAKRNTALAALGWKLFLVTTNTNEQDFITDLAHALAIARRNTS
jgi:very-short-patch-repair endonuclease